jgi:hypothetical protein
MGYIKNAMIELAEAGAVMAEIEQVQAWRAEGHDVPLVWVGIDTYRGRWTTPAIALGVAERLAVTLDDEDAREMLRQAVDDARSYLDAIGGPCRCDDCGVRGQPHFFVTSLDGENLCVNCA